MQPMINKGTEKAIMPGPEAEMDLARGESVPPAADMGDQEAIKQIVNNPAGFYFNVHSPLNPAGFARGQLQRVQ